MLCEDPIEQRKKEILKQREGKEEWRNFLEVCDCEEGYIHMAFIRGIATYREMFRSESMTDYSKMLYAIHFQLEYTSYPPSMFREDYPFAYIISLADRHKAVIRDAIKSHRDLAVEYLKHILEKEKENET